jgi:hypothetical protein
LLKKYFSEKTDIELAFLALTKGHQETAKGSISVMLVLFIGIQDINLTIKTMINDWKI